MATQVVPSTARAKLTFQAAILERACSPIVRDTPASEKARHDIKCQVGGAVMVEGDCGNSQSLDPSEGGVVPIFDRVGEPGEMTGDV